MRLGGGCFQDTRISAQDYINTKKEAKKTCRRKKRLNETKIMEKLQNFGNQNTQSEERGRINHAQLMYEQGRRAGSRQERSCQ